MSLRPSVAHYVSLLRLISNQALLNFEWVDLPALGLASVADAACSRLDHNDQNV
jgi:hypothetical protein